MAARFGEQGRQSVDSKRSYISNNTRASTDWDIRVWNEWATSRARTVAGVEGIVTLTRVHYLFIAHLIALYVI